jgi:flagellar protein FlgJ
MRIEAGSLDMAAGAASREHTRLVDAAQQFEAMLMQEMLKPLQSSKNKWDSGDEEVDTSMDTLSSYGTEAVAKAISKGGGLGIAKRVVAQVGLEREHRTGIRAEAEVGTGSSTKVTGTKVFGEDADKFK